jgi:N-acetylglutamate synthase-like GNAT family acetyltransferase
MEVSIRLAKTEDLEAIIDLQTQSLSNLPERFRKYDRQQIDSLIDGQAALRRIYFSGETTLVAEDDDRIPIGFISLSQPLISSQPLIAGLFVRPDFMNKGVGARLLRELDLLAIEWRINRIVVMSSMESVDFYKKNGYVFKRETGFFSQGLVWIPCELLEKELIPSTPIEKLATHTVKIVLSVVFLAIVTAILHKADKKPICCPATNCRVCPQAIAPSQKYSY